MQPAALRSISRSVWRHQHLPLRLRAPLDVALAVARPVLLFPLRLL
jgi:hypothetical protein